MTVVYTNIKTINLRSSSSSSSLNESISTTSHRTFFNGILADFPGQYWNVRIERKMDPTI
ncbi:MAG: hypothetical protein M3270_01055 [Thermoproteota archaeon]|nr:hypothetical protein [Thermoproteota archaeon]